MEVIIGKYKIYPLDKLNWTIAELCERTDPETNETSMQWVRREKYFSRPQFAAEHIYNRLLMESNGKLTLDAANAADVARLCDEACNTVICAVNALVPDDRQVQPSDVARHVTLADPETFKHRRRRKTTKKAVAKTASETDSDASDNNTGADTKAPEKTAQTDAEATPEPTTDKPKRRRRAKKADAS